MKILNHIPIPNSEREVEHMSNCLNCQETWPLFYRNNERLNKPDSWDLLCIKWITLSEKHRETLKSKMGKAEKRWLVSLKTGSRLGAFHLFTHSLNMSDQPLAVRMKVASEQWKVLSQSEKQPFFDKSIQLRNERKENLKKLSPSLKHVYKLYRKEIKKPIKQKVSNAFMCFLKAQWKESNIGQYGQVMKLATESWNKMTQDEKNKYKEESQTSLDLLNRGFQLNEFE